MDGKCCTLIRTKPNELVHKIIDDEEKEYFKRLRENKKTCECEEFSYQKRFMFDT